MILRFCDPADEESGIKFESPWRVERRKDLADVDEWVELLLRRVYKEATGVATACEIGGKTAFTPPSLALRFRG